MEATKETKGQAFVRLANARVRKALKAIKLLENLKNYPHDHGHTAKIVSVLRTQVDNVEYALGGEKQARKDDFDLDSEE